MYIEDRLYSVVMNEREYELYKLYSEDIDTFDENAAKVVGVGALAGAGGLGYLSKRTSDKTYKTAAENIMKKDPGFLDRKLKELSGNDSKWLESAKKSASANPVQSTEELLRNLGKDYEKASGNMKPIAENMKKGLRKAKNYKLAAIGTGIAGLGALGYGALKSSKNKD